MKNAKNIKVTEDISAWVDIKVEYDDDSYDDLCKSIDDVISKYNASIDVEDEDSVGVRFLWPDNSLKNVSNAIKDLKSNNFEILSAYYAENEFGSTIANITF